MQSFNPRPSRLRPRLGLSVLLGGPVWGLLAVGAVSVRAFIAKGQGAASNHAGHVLRQPAAVTNGLGAWYPLDGDARCHAGGVAATLYNFAGTSPYVAGKFGAARRGLCSIHRSERHGGPLIHLWGGNAALTFRSQDILCIERFVLHKASC
jgi:hypothetical protein